MHLIFTILAKHDRLEEPHLESDCPHSVLGSGLDSNVAKPTPAPGCEIGDEPAQRRILRKTFPVSKVPNVVIIFLPQKPSQVFAKKKNFVLEASQENLLAFLTEEIKDKEMNTVQVEISKNRKIEGD